MKNREQRGRIIDEPPYIVNDGNDFTDDERGDRNIVRKSLNFSGSSPRILKRLGGINCHTATSSDLVSAAFEIIRELNEIRGRSKNLSGKISRNMKQGFFKLNEIVSATAYRL